METDLANKLRCKGQRLRPDEKLQQVKTPHLCGAIRAIVLGEKSVLILSDIICVTNLQLNFFLTRCTAVAESFENVINISFHNWLPLFMMAIYNILQDVMKTESIFAMEWTLSSFAMNSKLPCGVFTYKLKPLPNKLLGWSMNTFPPHNSLRFA